MNYETLKVAHADGVTTITLNRPDAANALNLQVTVELMRAAIACDEDPKVRAVVLTGAGDKMFCAGGDLASFVAAGADAPAMVKEMTTNLHAAVSRFARMNAPVIAALNGTAAGGGLSLACGCDLAIAADNARFTMAYTRAGLTPDGSSTFFLARIVGLRRAHEMTLLNRVLSAQEALDWGLVNRVVAPDRVLPEALAMAQALVDGPLGAFGNAKRLILDGSAASLETQMEFESRAIADALRGDEGREGISAFFAKRPPKFPRE